MVAPCRKGRQKSIAADPAMIDANDRSYCFLSATKLLVSNVLFRMGADMAAERQGSFI